MMARSWGMIVSSLQTPHGFGGKRPDDHDENAQAVRPLWRAPEFYVERITPLTESSKELYGQGSSDLS